MTDTLEDHKGTVWIGSRTITNFHFADDIDGLAGEEEERVKLVERPDKASTAYGMEISAEKTKLMTNNTSGINTEIWLELDTAWDTLQVSKDNSNIDKVETSLEWQEYFSQFQDATDALPCHIHPPQWGAADAEIKVPSGKNTELKRSPFKAQSTTEDYIRAENKLRFIS